MPIPNTNALIKVPITAKNSMGIKFRMKPNINDYNSNNFDLEKSI